MPEYPEKIILGEGFPVFARKGRRAIALSGPKGGLKKLNAPKLEDGPEADGISYRLVLERVAKNPSRR
jgi:hypothetical protein